MRNKHWGCRGPLVIDARIKPHHAPPLVEDPAVTKKIDALAARGGPLASIYEWEMLRDQTSVSFNAPILRGS